MNLGLSGPIADRDDDVVKVRVVVEAFEQVKRPKELRNPFGSEEGILILQSELLKSHLAD